MFVAVPAHAGGPVDQPALSSTLPAVSAPNWKLGIAGGYIDEYELDLGDFERTASGERVQGEFSYAVPLTFSTGFQLDGSIGDLDGATTGYVGAHYFTRDPASHLLGLVGGYMAIGSNDIGRIGPEAEYYLDRVTLQGAFGFENSDDEGDDVFAYANLAYYPHDNLKLYVGYRRTLENDVGAAGFEWLMEQSSPLGRPMSLYAEGQVGEDDHSTVWAGLRFYFGEPKKSLIRRHREDDPVNFWEALKQIRGECFDFISPDEVINDGNACIPVKKQLKQISDIRLKRDIALLSRLENGLGLYRYRYVWSDEIYVGVMAQEVERIVPEAAVRGTDGYLSVDYARLGLRLMTWREWQEASDPSLAMAA